MGDKHPYTSAPGSLAKVITQFRKLFPATVTAETLKKLGLAPKNEGPILNALRFLGLIDEDGKKTRVAAKTFIIHDDAVFEQEFGKIVKSAYSGLFSLHEDASWSLDTNSLISYFRATDGTAAVVGERQAKTFRMLSALARHREGPLAKAPGTEPGAILAKTARKPKTSPQSPQKSAAPAGMSNLSRHKNGNFGLTVRIEINLPADGSQEAYDRIFKSIREKLLNG